MLAKELYPGNYQPTLSHVFIALLAKKGLLCKLFTQNIDCLERQAGVPGDLIVEAHGSFATQRCIDCFTPFPDGPMKEHVLSNRVPHCAQDGCNGLVKPNIVFFGEQLPSSFFQALPLVDAADLALVLGTSLAVQPFAMLPDRVPVECPRVLFNMERVGSLGTRPDDVLQLGDCDANICTLAEHLGWLDELNELWRETVGKEEAEKQLERIQRVKRSMHAVDMSKLTKMVGEATLQSDHEEEHGESSGEDGPTNPAEGEVHSVEREDATSSGAAVGSSEDPFRRTRDTPATSEATTKPEADDKQQEVDISHVGEHHKPAGVEEPDVNDFKITADAEAFMVPVSAPHFHAETKAEVKDKSVPGIQPAKEAASKDSHKS